MDFSRLRVKNLVFTVKDAIARNLANAASNTANSAAADATLALTAAQEAEITANAADAKADEALSHAAPVSSVNGKTGAVVLSASDVGAKPSSYEAPVSSVNGETGAVTVDVPSPAATDPLMDGAVSQGSSANYARADHIHPKDTSKANIASPTFTGTPKAPTAAVGTKTTQLATTEFVNNEVNNSGAISETPTNVSSKINIVQQYYARNNMIYSIRLSFHVTTALANNEILCNLPNIPQPKVGGAYWIRSASNGTFAGVNLQGISSSDLHLQIKAAGAIPVGDWYGLAVTYIGDESAT